MSKNTIIICTVVIIFYIIFLCHCDTPQSYGEFILKITDLEVCKGPKRKDCINMTARLENGTNLLIDAQLKENVIPTRGKVEAMMNNKPLLRLQMKKPCDHLFMKPLFQQIYNVSQNCEFKKGDYNLKVDIEDVAKKYYSGMFIYGKYTFKSVFYNDECNFSCVILAVTFSPKNKAK
ncbi:uncharacterized protein LOC123869716 [Maniola jurtina]|uniref:uncharacterized protein LOC123869716 n=1 Tax=Maniola jurtina TaxID=191418 RepID=UPI001E68C6D3|nr:uncharacterized protein LOC123869716 [Maniola jurtina]